MRKAMADGSAWIPSKALYAIAEAVAEPSGFVISPLPAFVRGRVGVNAAATPACYVWRKGEPVMSIFVVHEPADFREMPAESCCFCKRPSRTWHEESDVAVCIPCADNHEVSDIPAKKDWFSQAAVRRAA